MPIKTGVETVTLLVGAALAVLCVVVVIYPFLKPRMRGEGTDRPADGSSTPAELEPIYDAIRTLQLEYQLGKVPKNLYLEQLEGYRVQAASLLRQRAEYRTGTHDWALEQEILLARADLQATSGGIRPCSSCGSPASAASTACTECGAGLETGNS